MIYISVINVILKHYREQRIDKRTALELLKDIKEEEETADLDEVIYLVEGRNNIKIVESS